MRLFKYAAGLAAAGLLAIAIPAHSASASVAGAALNRTLPECKFDGVGLNDCLDFLRDVSGANIDVNWRALAETSVNKDAPVSVRLYGVSLRKALSVVLNEVSGGDGLTFYVDDNVIEVTTKAQADKILYVRVYPIDDILMDVPDFTDSPKFDLTGSSGGSGGGGSSGSGGQAQRTGGLGGGGLFGQSGSTANTEVVKTKEQRAQDLIQLIIATIQPDAWTDNGGTSSIKYFNGNLVVSAPRSVHEALGGDIE